MARVLVKRDDSADSAGVITEQAIIHMVLQEQVALQEIAS
jgi:hypothetical protein